MEEVHIFSHKPAELLNLTPEQVRRDLMPIGLSGNHRKGYNNKALFNHFGKTIDHDEEHKVAVVGVGNFRRTILGFNRKADYRLNIVVACEVDENKINTGISNVLFYNSTIMPEIIRSENTRITNLTVPPDVPPEIYLKK